MAHKFPDRIMKPADTVTQLWHLVDSVPELGKVALLQNVSQVLDLRYCFIFSLQYIKPNILYILKIY